MSSITCLYQNVRVSLYLPFVALLSLTHSPISGPCCLSFYLSLYILLALALLYLPSRLSLRIHVYLYIYLSISTSNPSYLFKFQFIQTQVLLDLRTIILDLLNTFEAPCISVYLSITLIHQPMLCDSSISI